MKNMKKKIMKSLALLLVVISVMSTAVGCGVTEQTGPVVPTEELLSATYDRNKEITDSITYKYDYMTYPNMDGLEVAMLFNHMKIQVDEMKTITMGISTMGDIVKIVNDANKYHVESNTQAVIDERQAVIDKEYEAAKKKAESKGKEYKKAKKQVRTDDIHFEEPYTYGIVFANNTNAGLQEYQETLLVDPTKNGTLFLDVYKYAVPYVRFEFKCVSKLYNDEIKQEADWVVNGVKASDVSAYKTVDANGQVILDNTIVDADMLNKAAKKNIFMSGNVAFGGEGFTWDSLMMFCNALQLEEDKAGHGYRKSSDENFTYYTIEFATNPFEFNNIPYERNEDGTIISLMAPTTRLVATFDPLTQICLNWTIDMYTNVTYYSNKEHQVGESIDVNVHKYKVDTNNYAGMREKINKWIDGSALKTTTAYCAIDETNRKEPIAGIVNTGLTNVTISPVVNDIEYTCLEHNKDEDGTITGTYQSTVDPNEKHTWAIKCCLLNESGAFLSEFINENEKIQIDNVEYVVVDFEKTDAGYKDVKLLTVKQIEELMLLYAKTYQLNNDQVTEMRNIYEDENFVNARKYVNNLFKDAEAAQEKNNKNDKNDENDENQNNKQEQQENNKEQLFLEELSANSELKDLGIIKCGESEIDINEVSVKDLEALEFEMLKEVYAYTNNYINSQGVYFSKGDIKVGVDRSEDDEIRGLVITTKDVECFGGLKVGMTDTEALSILGLEELNADRHVAVKSEDSSMFVWIDDNGVVEKIFVFENEYYGQGSVLTQEKDDVVVKDDNKETDNNDKTNDKEQNDEKEEQKDDDTLKKQAGSFAASMLIGMLFGLIVAVVSLLAMWKLFVKMEEPGWAAIVPLYNTWILCKHTWSTPILGMIGMLVPGLNFIFSIITIFKLCKKFDKGTLFCILSIFFSPICLLILGLGKDEYYDE